MSREVMSRLLAQGRMLFDSWSLERKFSTIRKQQTYSARPGPWIRGKVPTAELLCILVCTIRFLNFVCIHPDSLSNTGVINGWQQSVGKGTLLNIYQDLNPRIRKVLDKADPETLKIWPLPDLDTLPSWVNEQFALIGDAAHPFLPYRASGGAMAIEDGLSLAAMLPGDVNKEDIPERLKLYEKARHERVTTIQEFTWESGRRNLSVAEGKL